MGAIESLMGLAGKWAGANYLWLSPEEPARESGTEAELRVVQLGQFTEMRYTWADEGKPQEGVLLMREGKDGGVKAAWFDTWHMRDDFMVMKGEVDTGGMVSVTGSYAAPPGPDWGWRITIEPGGHDRFILRMYNIHPEGEEELAVEAGYVRSDAGEV